MSSKDRATPLSSRGAVPRELSPKLVAFALAMEGLITDTLRASLDLTGRVQADFEGIRLAPDAPGASCLLQQGQHALLRLVGLGQHGGGGLRNDLRLGQ
eukprot:gene27279-48835_t